MVGAGCAGPRALTASIVPAPHAQDNLAGSTLDDCDELAFELPDALIAETMAATAADGGRTFACCGAVRQLSALMMRGTDGAHDSVGRARGAGANDAPPSAPSAPAPATPRLRHRPQLNASADGASPTAAERPAASASEATAAAAAAAVAAEPRPSGDDARAQESPADGGSGGGSSSAKRLRRR